MALMSPELRAWYTQRNATGDYTTPPPAYLLPQAPAVDPNAGHWEPNPYYTGDGSNPGMFVLDASPTPTQATSVTPPQLHQQAPAAADFANRQSPELAQLQAVLGQMQQPQQPQLPPQAQAQLPPQAMRGMMQNGLFAGASGGLPAQARRTPGRNPMQLMQMLSQTGLMGGGT